MRFFRLSKAGNRAELVRIRISIIGLWNRHLTMM